MEEINRRLAYQYIKFYNEMNVEGMCACLHEHIHFEHIADGKVVMALDGIEALRAQAEAAVAMCASRTQTVAAWHSDGAIGIAEIVYSAVFKVDLPNGLKAGEVLELVGRSEFEFAEGNIIRLRDFS